MASTGAPCSDMTSTRLVASDGRRITATSIFNYWGYPRLVWAPISSMALGGCHPQCRVESHRATMPTSIRVNEARVRIRYDSLDSEHQCASRSVDGVD